jgi:hypothetical protein
MSLTTASDKGDKKSEGGVYSQVKDGVYSSISAVSSSLANLLNSWLIKPTTDFKDKTSTYLLSNPSIAQLHEYSMIFASATRKSFDQIATYSIQLKDSAVARGYNEAHLMKLSGEELKWHLEQAVAKAQKDLKQANQSLAAYSNAVKEKAAETATIVGNKAHEVVQATKEKAQEAAQVAVQAAKDKALEAQDAVHAAKDKAQERAQEAKVVVSEHLQKLREAVEADLAALNKAMFDVLHWKAAIDAKEEAKVDATQAKDSTEEPKEESKEEGKEQVKEAPKDAPKQEEPKKPK